MKKAFLKMAQSPISSLALSFLVMSGAIGEDNQVKIIDTRHAADHIGKDTKDLWKLCDKKAMDGAGYKSSINNYTLAEIVKAFEDQHAAEVAALFLERPGIKNTNRIIHLDKKTRVNEKGNLVQCGQISRGRSVNLPFWEDTTFDGIRGMLSPIWNADRTALQGLQLNTILGRGAQNNTPSDYACKYRTRDDKLNDCTERAKRKLNEVQQPQTKSSNTQNRRFALPLPTPGGFPFPVPR